VEHVHEFLGWAWGRHHNELSWYVRALLTVPFCYFAYKRNLVGVVTTLVAIVTSMFWFPAPESVDGNTATFLEVERRYVEQPWTLAKVTLLALIPIWFAAVTWAFWNRSWLVGLAVVNAGVLAKILWSFDVAGTAAWSIIPAVVLGLVVTNAVFWWAYRNRHRIAPASRG
jgi:hypothetical protein